jgi:hypothetical protein
LKSSDNGLKKGSILEYIFLVQETDPGTSEQAQTGPVSLKGKGQSIHGEERKKDIPDKSGKNKKICPPVFPYLSP